MNEYPSLLVVRYLLEDEVGRRYAAGTHFGIDDLSYHVAERFFEDKAYLLVHLWATWEEELMPHWGDPGDMPWNLEGCDPLLFEYFMAWFQENLDYNRITRYANQGDGQYTVRLRITPESIHIQKLTPHD
jgi:hypothetical protein